MSVVRDRALVAIVDSMFKYLY